MGLRGLLNKEAAVHRRWKSDDLQVRPDAHRDEPDVDVGETDREKAQPREQLVTFVEPRHLLPNGVLSRRAPAIRAATDEMTERVTRERVEREERRVQRDDERAEADVVVLLA